MIYVDGFVTPVPLSKLTEYKKMSRKMGKLFRKYGALSYAECAADDVKPGKITSFPQAVKLKDGETVVFGWATYKSRRDRDRMWKLMMADPVMAQWDPKSAPFDGKRMFWGGFKSIVEA